MLEGLPHPVGVPGSVGLCPRRLHSRALRAVQQAKLNTRCIYSQAHQASKRINLSHNLSLRKAADSRIAAYLGYGVFADGYKSCSGADFSGGIRGLDAGVACTYDNAIELTRPHYDIFSH